MGIERIDKLKDELLTLIKKNNHKATIMTNLTPFAMGSDYVIKVWDGYYVNQIYMSFIMQFEIRSLIELVKLHTDIVEADLQIMFCIYEEKFKLLNDLQKHIPNLVETMRSCDPNDIICGYVKIKKEIKEKKGYRDINDFQI